MSLRFFASCSKIMSPALARRGSSTYILDQVVPMSSSSKNPKAPTTASTSATETKKASKAKASKKDECGPQANVPEPPPPEDKGDTYKAGESYFSYNPYSFYDIENQMQADRLKQPNAGSKAP